MMHHILRISFLFLTPFILGSCYSITKPISITLTASNTYLPDIPTSTPQPTITLTPPYHEYFLDDLSISIQLPSPYVPVKSTEEGRRGTFISYDMKPYLRDLPALREVQFFSEESIREYNSHICAIGPCFEGDFPDLNRYLEQKKWFTLQNGTTYGNPITLGGIIYLATTRVEHLWKYREYTTFINNIKIDIWVELENIEQEAIADDLVDQVRLIIAE
jgi:hypothetical protein